MPSASSYDAAADGGQGFRMAGAEKLGFVTEMFDRIARRYDAMNLLISLGQTSLWRFLCFRAMARRLGENERVLDVGCGSGVSTYALRRQLRHLKLQTVGVDPSSAMLDVARANDPAGTYELGSAENLAACFEPGEFDAVYSVYTLRNFADTNAAVRAMAHVLAPGGTLVILDAFPPPKGSFMAVALRFWMNVVVAAIVKPFTDAKAYRYLAASIEQTRTPEETADILRREGFEDVQITTYSFGAAAMLLGSKR